MKKKKNGEKESEPPSRAKRRKWKKTDQKNTEKAFQYLLSTINSHPEVEISLWSGALWTLLVNGYISADLTYAEFLEDFDRAKEHYKDFWVKQLDSVFDQKHT